MRWIAALLLICSLGHSAERAVTLACVGDVMLGRDVRRLCATAGDDYPFARVAPLVRQADLAFCNLESPLTGRTLRFPRVNALVGAPSMAGALGRAGFDVVSLANNHAIDAERAGLLDTMSLLKTQQIAVTGAGPTRAEAESGVVKTVRGLRVGFAAFSHFPYTNFGYDPARATVLMLNEPTLRTVLPSLAKRCDALVVSFHWGCEGDRAVTPYERHLARLAVNLGATLVVGHHAHVRGPVERYRNSLIAYCLGNCVFDTHSNGGNEGYLLTCRLARQKVLSYSLLPTNVVQCQAVPERRTLTPSPSPTGRGVPEGRGEGAVTQFAAPHLPKGDHNDRP